MTRTAQSRTLTAATAAAALLLTAACGSDTPESSSAAASEDSANVAAVIKGLDNPFFQSMERGIEEQAAESDVDVTVQAATSITDTTGQADKLTSMAGQDFSCFIINPISGTNLVQGIAQLAAQDKTIVNIDSPIDAEAAQAAGADVATYIGTDNVEAGQLAGEHMVALLPDGGEVAVVGGIAGDVTSAARIEGFTEGVGSSLTIAQTVAANWDRQEALTQATNILRANPQVKGFFAANDDMGLGISRAIANAGKTGQIKVISVDGNPDAFEAVKAGGLDATVAQYPYAIGLMGVEACQAAAAGETLPEEVKAPVQLITRDNVDKAIEAAPKPAEDYDDPFAALIGG